MTKTPRNAHERALNRISKVVARYGGGTHPAEPIIVTMLMDLRHFCADHKLDFAEMNERAGSNYAHEELYAD